MNARDVAYGYAIGYNDGIGGEASDDWQPPAEWIPVPEPDEYDIYALVNSQQPQSTVTMTLADINGSGGNGTIVCDWGDGTTEELTGVASISHVYNNMGQFLIHIVCTDKNNHLSGLGSQTPTVYYLIIKTGKNIVWATRRSVTFTDTVAVASLKSLTILNDNSISDINNQGLDSIVSFRNMYVLQKLQCPKVYVSNLNASGGFLSGSSARNIKNILQCFDLSKCTSVGNMGFNSGKSKQTYVLKIIEKFLISWDPDVTDVKPDERVGC